MASEGNRPPVAVKCPYCGTLRETTATECPKCGLGHTRKRRKKPLAPPPPPPTRAFGEEVFHAFVYPLVPRSLLLLVGAALYFSAFKFIFTGGAWYRDREDAGYVAFGILVTGFVFHCFLDVVQSSAGGRRKFPAIFTKLEYTPYESLALGTIGLALAFLPSLLYLLLVHLELMGMSRVAFAVLRAIGCLYLPMALLSLAVWRDLKAALPHVVLPAVARLPWPNAVAAVLLWGASSLQTRVIAAGLSDAPFGLLFLGNLAALYLYFVAARIIGITHWVYRKEFGWFRNP